MDPDDFRPLLTRWEMKLYGISENGDMQSEYLRGFLDALDHCLTEVYDLLGVTADS